MHSAHNDQKIKIQVKKQHSVCTICTVCSLQSAWSAFQHDHSVHAAIHFIVLTRVRFTGLTLANLSFLLILRRIQDLRFGQILQKRFMLHTVKETLQDLGENAGQQCVAISLCALIYSKTSSNHRLMRAFECSQLQIENRNHGRDYELK